MGIKTLWYGTPPCGVISHIRRGPKSIPGSGTPPNRLKSYPCTPTCKTSKQIGTLALAYNEPGRAGDIELHKPFLELLNALGCIQKLREGKENMICKSNHSDYLMLFCPAFNSSELQRLESMKLKTCIKNWHFFQQN